MVAYKFIKIQNFVSRDKDLVLKVFYLREIRLLLATFYKNSSDK